LIVLLSVITVSSAASPVIAQEATAVAAPAIVSELEAALNAHDAAVAAALYSEDAVVTQAV
jgi:ketosteroid isomerase-like protein